MFELFLGGQVGRGWGLAVQGSEYSEFWVLPPLSNSLY